MTLGYKVKYDKMTKQIPHEQMYIENEQLVISVHYGNKVM